MFFDERKLQIFRNVIFRKLEMQDDGRVKTNFNLSLTFPDESANFLYVLYIFYNTLYTMPKISRKNMFDSDSSDDEHYFEPRQNKIEDDDSASDNGTNSV